LADLHVIFALFDKHMTYFRGY